MIESSQKSYDIHTPDLSGLEVSDRFIRILPFLGIFLGALMWFIDAVVDAFIIIPEETLIKALLTESSKEVWMRSLVLLLFTASSVFVQYFMKKQRRAEVLLLSYQQHLENIVAARTVDLQKIADFDSLTQIYNRNKFTRCFEVEKTRSLRYQFPLSVILCDIDHFKSVNDRFGHDEGDRVLQAFADVLRMNLRKNDIYARWGGEEFAILLPHTDLSNAEKVAEKLRHGVFQIQYGEEGKWQNLTASFGVSNLSSNESINPLIKKADVALYEAKHSGRNRVCSAL